MLTIIHGLTHSQMFAIMCISVGGAVIAFALGRNRDADD
jgi:hypothetical protein